MVPANAFLTVCALYRDRPRAVPRVDELLYEDPMTARPIRIGTRGSPLALAQAHMVRDLLTQAHGGLAVPEIVVIKTTGDRITDRPLAEIGGKGLFTKELETALLDDGIDIAVHSMKDVATWLPDALTIDCLLPRADPRDALFAKGARTIAGLPAGAIVGTASLRRGAQILACRPDIKVVPLRGNVQTRLGKFDRGEVDATLLAVAGLNRLGLADLGHVALPIEEMLPAAAQGAIGIERRADDAATAALLAPLNDPATATCVAAERALLAALDGSCRTPIAALAELTGDQVHLRGLVVMPDGSAVYRAEQTGSAVAAATLGDDLGNTLRAAAGPEFFAALV